jgi:hypothetical protein
MIYIILFAVAVAIFSYFVLREKRALTKSLDSFEDYPLEYTMRRKERSDKGKKRGPYKKGKK